MNKEKGNIITCSQIINYNNCPKQFHFIYKQGKRIQKNIFMVLGICYDHVLECHYNLKFMDKKGLNPQDGGKLFCSKLKSILDSERVRFPRWGSLLDYMHSGKSATIFFLQNIENEISPLFIQYDPGLILIPGTNYYLNVRFDVFELNGGITDFKLRAKPTTQIQADKDLQLSIYCWAHYVRYQELPTFLRFSNMIRKGKNTENFHMFIETKRTMEDINKIEKFMINIVNQMDKNKFPENTNNPYCKPGGCDFWFGCQQFK